MVALCTVEACAEPAMENGGGLCEPHFEARREQLKASLGRPAPSSGQATAQRKKEPAPVWRRGAKLAFVATLLVAVAFGVRLLWDSREDSKPGIARVVEADAARAIVAQRMKDPNSATFQNERSGKFGSACGEVNARNSYGGYVGYMRYILIPGADPLFESDPGFIDFDEQWSDLCS